MIKPNEVRNPAPMTITRLSTNPKIVFMGTPDFAVPSLQALIRHNYHVAFVVTQPDRPKGRGRKLAPPPVKLAALEWGLKVLQPEKVSSKEFCSQVAEVKPDLLVVVAFGQLLKKSLLEIPKWGAINIHASLLPKYRGAAPIQWAILNDEKITGLTSMKIDEGMDTGPILIQQEVEVSDNETAGQLHDRLAPLAGDLLIKTLDRLIKGEIEPREQDHSKATYAPMLDKSQAKVDWSRPANKVAAQIRAFDPWPGAWTKIDNSRVKLFSAFVVDETRTTKNPGRVVGLEEDFIKVETGAGLVGIGELQAPGRKRLRAGEFVRGFHLSLNALLE